MITKHYSVFHTRQCRKLLVLIITFLLLSAKVFAQGLHHDSRLFVNVYGGAGVRSFHASSDIGELDGLNIEEEGFNFGLVFGGNIVQSWLRKGIYSSSQTMSTKVNLSETSGGVNFYLHNLLGLKNKYFKPYFSIGFNRSSLSFFGKYDIPVPPVLMSSDDECGGSHDDDQPLPDPDFPYGPPGESVIMSTDATTRTVDGKLGAVIVSKGELGLGLTFQIPLERRYFVNLFSEAVYGFSMDQQSSNDALLNTRVKAAMAFNFGIAFGRKSHTIGH